MPALLLAGGFAVGVLALAARALGHDSQDVLFSGQTSIGVAVDAGSILRPPDFARRQGPGLRREPRSGFRGGPIFPAIFIGVALASLPVAAFGDVPDAGRRDRGGGRDGRPDPPVALAAPPGLAARRADRNGHDPRRGPCLGHGLDRGDRAGDRRGQRPPSRQRGLRDCALAELGEEGADVADELVWRLVGREVPTMSKSSS